MSNELALQAGLWYNGATKIIALGGAVNTPSRIYLFGRYIMDIVPQKRCTVCTGLFPATPEYFHRDTSRKDGYRDLCKVCVKAYQNQPEVHAHILDKTKEYYRRPGVSERQIARHKALYSIPEVHEKRLAQYKEYHHRPEIQEHTKAHDKEYGRRPDVLAQRRVKNANYQARKKSILGSHSVQQIQELLKRQKYKCYYCSTLFEKHKDKFVYHVDHTFPVSRIAGTDIPGNDIDYLVLTCPACNISKQDKFPWEWPEGGRLL